MTLYLDGEPLQSYIVKLDVNVVSSNLTVGYLDPLIYPGLNFVGLITQFNAWNEMLTHSVIESIAQCGIDLLGNKLSWESNWMLRNSSFYVLTLDKLCDKTRELKMKILPAMNFFESAFLCEGLGGQLSIPSSYPEASQMVSAGRAKANANCTLFWTGIWDVPEEGIWTAHINGSKLAASVWAPDEPNGLHFENCAGLDKEGFADDDCEVKRCDNAGGIELR